MTLSMSPLLSVSLSPWKLLKLSSLLSLSSCAVLGVPLISLTGVLFSQAVFPSSFILLSSKPVSGVPPLTRTLPLSRPRILSPSSNSTSTPLGPTATTFPGVHLWGLLWLPRPRSTSTSMFTMIGVSVPRPISSPLVFTSKILDLSLGVGSAATWMFLMTEGVPGREVFPFLSLIGVEILEVDTSLATAPAHVFAFFARTFFEDSLVDVSQACFVPSNNPVRFPPPWVPKPSPPRSPPRPPVTSPPPSSLTIISSAPLTLLSLSSFLISCLTAPPLNTL
mmetsp:Transcript_17657/g.36663  ORF Transcript_17657/g.36663 Transcript_17657/m.36663 type:complete len:279 (-) Transcript_17657:2167-3003(-)